MSQFDEMTPSMLVPEQAGQQGSMAPESKEPAPAGGKGTMHDYSKVDWSKVLAPSQEARDEKRVRLGMMEDYLTIAEKVRGGAKPEAFWQDLNLSRATGLPFSKVEEYPDTALMRVYRQGLSGDLEGMRRSIEQSPNMLEFVSARSGAEAAALATDKPLWDLEAMERGFLDDTAHSWRIGNMAQERLAILNRIFEGGAGKADEERLAMLDERLAFEAERREGEDTSDWIWRSSTEQAPQLMNLAGNVLYRGTQGLGLGALGGAAIGSVAPGVGTVAGGVAGGVGGAKTGASYGALEHSYLQSRGEIYGSIRNLQDEHGNKIDPDVARWIAAVGALPMAGLDFASLRTASQVIPGLNTLLNKALAEKTAAYLAKNPSLLKSMGEAGLTAAKALAAEITTEIAQEGVVIGAEEFAKGTGHLDLPGVTGEEVAERLADTGKQTFAAVLPLAGAGGIGRGAVNIHRYNGRRGASKAGQAALDNLYAVSAESETIQNAPDLAGEVIKHLGEESGASEIYASPEAIQRVLFQTDEGMAIAAQLGITPESLAESLALETDIAIPMDAAMLHLFNTPQGEELRADLRHDPEHLTGRELAAESEGAALSPEEEAERTGEFLGFLESMEADLALRREEENAREAVVAPYIQQLVTAGHTETQARHLFAPYMANAEIMAPMFGQTPGEYLNQRLSGFTLTTPELFGLSEEQLNQREKKNLREAAKTNPLLQLVRGRLDGASLKDYDSRGYADLRRVYGPGLFKSKNKGGQALDLLADEAVRQGLLPEGSGANELLAALSQRGREYGQPLNPGVNLDAPVPVVSVEPQFAGQNPKLLRKRFPAKVRQDVLAAFASPGVANEDTGKRVGMTSSSFKEHLKFEDSDGIGGLMQLEAIAALPELMRTAKLVESYKDKKSGEDSNIKMMHRFQAALRLGDQDYSVKLTVKEFEDGKLHFADDTPVKLYHHRLEKELSAGNSVTLQDQSLAVKRPSADNHSYTLRQLLEDVNDSEGKVYFQSAPPTESEAFKKWFGDSKVVDENGKPLIVYHFGSFNENSDTPREGMHFGSRNAAGDIEKSWNKVPRNKDTAQYTGVYLNIRNPKRVEDVEVSNNYFEWADVVDDAKTEGHDGLVYINDVEDVGSESYVAFYPEQIKSVNNRGAFDPNDPRILYQSANQRGAITWPDPAVNEKAVIGLFAGKKNLSTVIHEAGHFFLENLREASSLENSPAWVKESWLALQKEYGFEGDVIPDAAHERFAREFEAYAREGKAPSGQLASAFRQFKNWLTGIYRSVRGLLGEGELSPEVREAFDRLLATEEEIAQASEASGVRAVFEEAPGQLTPELQGRYEKVVEAARLKAESVIAARRLSEQRTAEKIFSEEARAEVNARPFYRMEEELRAAGGLNWQSTLDELHEDAAWDLRRKWEGLITEKGEVSFADAALDYGYDSSLNLAGALLDNLTRRDAVQAEVAARLAEWDATFEASGEYSAAFDEVLAIELEALTGQKQLSGARYRAELDRRIGVKKASEVDAEYKALKTSLRKQEAVLSQLMREARKEDRAKDKAWRDRLAAVRQEERLKRAALAAAYRARMERDKLTRHIRKEAQSKSVPRAFKEQQLALIAHWRGLGTKAMQPSDPESVLTLIDFSRQFAGVFGDGETVFADWLYAESSRAGVSSARDLTLEELRDVHEAIKIIGHQGRNFDRFLAFGREVRISEAAAECLEPMRKLTGKEYISEIDRAKLTGKIRGAMRGGLSDITGMRFLFNMADGYVASGGKKGEKGPNHKYSIDILQEAMSREMNLQRDFGAKAIKILEPLNNKEAGQAFRLDGVPLPDDVHREWGGMFTKEKALAVALNMGNEGNLSALSKGYGWNENHLAGIAKTMTVREWESVQAVWKLLDELYPVINETYQAQYGVALPRVEAKPFTVQAADGEVALDGGYYPLVFDHKFSQKAAEQQTVDEALNRNEAVIRKPKPKSGMTKERTGGTLPPRLSLDVLQSHIADSIHYATHAIPLRDISQMFNLPEYRSEFIRSMGQENYEQLLPWLRHIARPEGQALSRWAKGAEGLARRGTIFVLGLNMKSAFLQLTSFGNSVVEVGAGQFAKGAYQMITKRSKAYRTVQEKSAYMMGRSVQMDASIREQMERFSPQGAAGVEMWGMRLTLSDVQNAQFAVIQALDAAIAYPTWIGAYDKAVAAGVPEAQAIHRADEAVISAQGSGGRMDTTKILRERGYIKLLTPFITFAMNDFNRKRYFAVGYRERLRGGNSAIGTREFLVHFALEWVTPVVLSTMMMSLGRDGELPEAEDFVWESAGFLTMGIPLVRDVASYGERLATGKGGGGRMGGSVGFAGFEAAGQAVYHGVKAIREDDEAAAERTAKELAKTIGFALGISPLQWMRSWEGGKAYFVDDEGGPLAPFLGKPRK